MPISPVMPTTMPDDDPQGSTDVDAPQVPEDDGSGSGQVIGGEDSEDQTGSLAAGSSFVAPKRASYADKYGPILSAFDQKIAATQTALKAAQQTQTIAKQHAALASQRHAIALKAATESNSVGGGSTLAQGQPKQPQGALSLPGNNQPSHDEILHSFDDKHFEEANAEYKKKTGKSADELYDMAVEKGKIPPTDEKLTKRQKSHLFIKFGLEMLKNSQQGIATAIGNAGSATLDEYDQMKAAPAAADAAEEERVGKIRMDQAKNAGETERTRITQSGEDSRAEKERQNRLDVANIGAKAKETTASEKPAKENPTYTNADGYLMERLPNGKSRHVTEIGPDGKDVWARPQKTKEDSDREDDKADRAKEAKSKRVGAAEDVIRKDPLGARIKDPVTGKYRAMTDDEIHEKAVKKIESDDAAVSGKKKNAFADL